MKAEKRGGWSQNLVTFRDGYILQNSGGYRQRSEYFERALSIVDFNNRLREAINPGGLNIQYSYDPFNRRILKKLTTGPLPLTTVFVWDDQEVVEEYTKLDTNPVKLSKQYVPAQQIDQKISANVDMNGNGNLKDEEDVEYFYLQDQLGNVEAIVDNQGNKMEEYDYRGYGNARIYAPDSTAPQVEQIRTLSDGKLLILFTEPLYPDSVTSTTVQVLDANQNPVSIAQSLSSDKRLLTIAGSFTEGASYTLKFDGVRDLALNALASTLPPSAFSLGTVLYDTKAPAIERIWQNEGNVYVSFTEDLAAAGVAADAVQIVRNALPATGTATLADARTIQFIPDQAPIDDASYSLTVSASVSDLSGSPLTPNPSPLLFQFTQLPVAFYTRADQRQERSTSAFKNFHLFQGREAEPETELIYVRARWLDSSLGTWTTEDPSKYKDSYNLHQLLNLDYENNIDPKGSTIIVSDLSSIEKEEIIQQLEQISKQKIIACWDEADKSNETLQFADYRANSSVSEFLNQAFTSKNLYTHLYSRPKSKYELAQKESSSSVMIDFVDFRTINYGRYPALADSFNLGWVLIHELAHIYKGMNDYYSEGYGPPPGIDVRLFSNPADFASFIKDKNWESQHRIYTGPVVDFVNKLQGELGLLKRTSYKAFDIEGLRKTRYYNVQYNGTPYRGEYLTYKLYFEGGWYLTYANMQ